MKVGAQASSTAVGIGQAQAFQIKTSPKAFEILSSGIYSDKILAPIRELSANAIDAHKIVGTPDLPFEVQLPTNLEPILRVRDFGPGLSEEGAMTLYTTYFESTKSDSNDYIGCLGLGSKSPFAYTDSFSVESYQEGRVSIYVACILDGLPSISKVSELPTVEPNGLAVSFAVQSADIIKFQQKAFELFSWFRVKPTTNMVSTVPNKSRGLLEIDGMYLRDKPSYSDPTVTVIMGEIAYPVNGHDLGMQYSWKWDQQYKGLVIRAEIGDVDMATSRESLGFTEKTKKWIKDKVDGAAKVFVDVLVNKDLESCTHWWEAYLKSRRYCSIPLLESVNFAYKGEVIPRTNAKVDTKKVIIKHLDSRNVPQGRGGYLPPAGDYKDLKFYLNDVKSGFIKRLIVASEDCFPVLVEVPSGSTLTEACEELKIQPSELTNLSTLSYSVVKRTSVAAQAVDYYLGCPGLTQPADLDTNQPIYCIAVRRNRMVVGDYHLPWYSYYANPQLAELIKTARDCGWIEDTAQIVGIQAHGLRLKKLKDTPQVIQIIWDKVKEAVEASPEKYTINSLNQYSHSDVQQLLVCLQRRGIDIPPIYSQLYEVIKTAGGINRTKKENEILIAFGRLAPLFNYTSPTVDTNSSQLADLWKDFTATDPLGALWNVTHHYHGDHIVSAIKDRIELLQELEEHRPLKSDTTDQWCLPLLEQTNI